MDSPMGLTLTNSSDSAAPGFLTTQEVANAAQSLLLEATASLSRDRSGHDFVTETLQSSPRSISTFDDYPLTILLYLHLLSHPFRRLLMQCPLPRTHDASLLRVPIGL